MAVRPLEFQQGLVDVYHLFVNPAAIGAGMPVFLGLDVKLRLRLVKATPFECGIVVLHYEPVSG
jgi:dihydrofolate reductase